MDPRLSPLSEQDFDLVGIDIVVNTNLHFDHCGGNHLFAGKPIYVQRMELDDARPGRLHDPRVGRSARLAVHAGRRRARAASRAPTRPGAGPHARTQVETGGRPIVIGGDMAVWFGELDEPQTEGQLLVRSIDPELVWLAHVDEPWRPPA
jgi:N-acyl homoserine lactone hydrolase